MFLFLEICFGLLKFTIFRQEALKALSEDLLEKFKNLEEENSALKSKVGELETLINSKIEDITTELGLLKEKVGGVISN